MKPAIILICFFLVACSTIRKARHISSTSFNEVGDVLRKQILEEAAWALQQEPVTVTAQTSSRSAGGKHDFFSEADYWWPNPKSPDSPYLQRDGMTNPENFVARRHAMIRLSRIVGALPSAYKISDDTEANPLHAQRRTLRMDRGEPFR